MLAKCRCQENLRLVPLYSFQWGLNLFFILLTIQGEIKHYLTLKRLPGLGVGWTFRIAWLHQRRSVGQDWSLSDLHLSLLDLKREWKEIFLQGRRQGRGMEQQSPFLTMVGRTDLCSMEAKMSPFLIIYRSTQPTVMFKKHSVIWSWQWYCIVVNRWAEE